MLSFYTVKRYKIEGKKLKIELIASWRSFVTYYLFFSDFYMFFCKGFKRAAYFASYFEI